MSRHVRSFQMFDRDEAYAPPTRPILDITMVGDALYLEIARTEESYGSRKAFTVSEICVDRKAFIRMLLALNDQQEAENGVS